MATVANPIPLASAPAMEQIAVLADAPLRRGHHVRILHDGALAFPAMIAAIRAAEHAICFENFIFAHDRTGEQFAVALEEAARRGVDVRVIYDPIGTLLVKGGSIRRRLKKGGVVVRPFRPFTFKQPWSWLHLYYRDHRKLLVIDDVAAFVGGINIGDNWSPASHGGKGWRDTAAVVRGPAVMDCQLAFERMWRRALERIPGSSGASQFTLPAARIPAVKGDTDVVVVGDRPRTHRVAALYEWLAERAQTSFDITDAYFVAPKRVLDALVRAARRGVRVRLLLPGRNNHPVAGLAARRIYEPLLEAGAEIWEWGGVMLHAKTAVVDGRISLIGSSNLDPLSLHRNYELNVVVGPGQASDIMVTFFQADLQSARRLDLTEWRARPLIYRLAERVAWLFSWNL
jgi:cardiolipin synthase